MVNYVVKKGQFRVVISVVKRDSLEVVMSVVKKGQFTSGY